MPSRWAGATTVRFREGMNPSPTDVKTAKQIDRSPENHSQIQRTACVFRSLRCCPIMMRRYLIPAETDGQADVMIGLACNYFAARDMLIWL